MKLRPPMPAVAALGFMLLLMGAPSRSLAALGPNAVASLRGRTARVQPDGSFILRNIPSGGGKFRVRVYADEGGFADAIRRTLSDRDTRARAGLARARLFSWEESARRAVAAYREAIG